MILLYKDELIYLHQLMLYLCRFLMDNGVPKSYFDEYTSLNISPHHIHKRKIEHKCAVLTMSKCISEALSENDIVPRGIVGKFDSLIKRCEDDIY
ncbi:MAG: UPF0058 family protein [Candidatus Hydrothermarchaeaceae archaeon]